MSGALWIICQNSFVENFKLLGYGMILATSQSWIQSLHSICLCLNQTLPYIQWDCWHPYADLSISTVLDRTLYLRRPKRCYVYLQERGLSVAMQPPSVPAGVWKHVWVKWGPMRQKVMKPVDVCLIFYNSTNICDDWPDAADEKSVWEKERKRRFKTKPDQSESAVWMVSRTGFTLLLGLKKHKMGSLRGKTSTCNIK